MMLGSLSIPKKKGHWVIMKTLKTVALATMLVALFAAVAVVSAGSLTAGEDQFDAAATYKAKCAVCHGQKVEKKFDVAKADADHVQVVLKGKKMEKPPHMPSYEEKGITLDQASAMVAYMRSIKQ
jgi:mono/diheme cytochrome c family protein